MLLALLQEASMKRVFRDTFRHGHIAYEFGSLPHDLRCCADVMLKAVWKQ